MRPTLASLLLTATGSLLPALSGCGGDPSPGCAIVQESPLEATPLAGLREASLVPIGDNFVLVGHDGETVRWAALGTDGKLGPESAAKLPARTQGPWFAVTSESAPADQLVVLYLAPRADVPGQLQLLAVTHDRGTAMTSPPRVLWDVPAGADPKAVQVAAGTSRTGLRAAVAYGVEGQTAPMFVLLKGDGEPIAPPALVYPDGSPKSWTCLAAAPSHTEIGFSVTEPGGARAGVTQPSWHMFELRDDGKRGTRVALTLDTGRLGCPTVAPTSRGYVLVWQNTDGTSFAHWDMTQEAVDSDLIAGANRFGGPQNQPRPACVAGAGKQFALAFDRGRGPEIWRFDDYGDKRGSALLLRAEAGAVGPVSCTPAPGGLWVTYLDGAASSPSPGNQSINRRTLTKVACTAEGSAGRE